VSEGRIKSSIFYISALCCVVLTIKIWSGSTWQRPKWNEIACLIASLTAVIVWVIFKQNTLAHFIAVGALPIAFIPTWKDAWDDWRKEDSASWALWSIGDMLAIAVVLSDLKSREELPYAVMEFICHAGVWLIVRIKHAPAP